jgi:hypothetical protein
MRKFTGSIRKGENLPTIFNVTTVRGPATMRLDAIFYRTTFSAKKSLH